MVLPVSAATLSRASITLNKYSSATCGAACCGLRKSDAFRHRLAAADFAGKAAPSERTPHQRADFLIEAERHELPLVFAANERVVNLVRNITRVAEAIGNGQRLHQVPAGKIRRGNVADLSFADKLVERVLHFFNGRKRVKAVQVVDVDVVGAEAAKACLKRVAQMVARRAFVIGARSR